MGFNLPFDLSRIAVSCRTHTRGRYREYFTFDLIENDLFTPKLAIRSLDSKKAFIELTRPAKTTVRIPAFKGYFLDLRTLAFALTNESHSLDSACRLFEVKQGKQKIEKHGTVNFEYIDYNRQDVLITWELYKKLQEEYEKHPLKLLPTKAYSPASLGKAYLKKMGIKPLHEKQPDFDLNMLGHAMAAYYGGRSECHIRKTVCQVLYTDMTSMYPTVFTLQGLWDWVIADKLEVIEATEEIKSFVDNISLDKLFNKKTWQAIPGLVQIKPEKDVLPVRAKYSKNAYQIGLNYLSSKEPLWYTLADVIVSRILTGKTPQIIKAYRIKAGKPQKGLNPVKLRGEVEVNPGKENFFKKVIEERAKIKKQMKVLSKDSNEYKRKESLQLFLKILANSTSYGIYIELNENELDKEETIDVYGLEHYPVSTAKIEKNGYFTNPLTAIMITGASRLLLAMIEKQLHDNGLDYVFCDTDSMVMRIEDKLQEQKAKEIVDRFTDLNPYDPGAIPSSILKLEDENFALADWDNPNSKITKELYPLYCYMVSAKRYVLFNIVNEKIIIRKKSDHGLGHLKNPASGSFEDLKENNWIDEIWHYILSQELGLAWDKPSWWDYPAMGQHTVSKPHLSNAFKKINKNKAYSEQIKPYNFMSIWYREPLSGQDVTPISPFVQPDSIEEVADLIVGRKTGEKLDLWSLMHSEKTLKTYGNIIEGYAFHPESKFVTPNGISCPKDYKGLLVRTNVKAKEIRHIGKEANNLEEANIFGIEGDSYTEYINKTWERVKENILKIGMEKLSLFLINNGLSQNELDSFLDMETPPKNIIGILQVLLNYINEKNLTEPLNHFPTSKELSFTDYRYIPYWNVKDFTVKLLVKDKGNWFFLSGKEYAYFLKNKLIKRYTVKEIMKEITFKGGVLGTKAFEYPEFLPVVKYAPIHGLKMDEILKAVDDRLFDKNEVQEVNGDLFISRAGMSRVFKGFKKEEEFVDIDDLRVMVKKGRKIFEFPLQQIQSLIYRRRKGNSRNAEVLAEISGQWFFMPVKDNGVIFKKKIIARPKEIKMEIDKNGYLQSGLIQFPQYASLEEAIIKWQIPKKKLMKDIEEGLLKVKGNRISRLELARYLSKKEQHNKNINS